MIKKYVVVHFIGILIISAVFYLLANLVEKDLVLKNSVIPPPGVKLPQWLDSFKFWANCSVTASVLAILLWYVIAQWGIKVNHWLASGKRVIWGLIFILPIAAAILGFVFTKQAQEGGWYAYLFYILNGLLCYYLATAWFSPLSFKYTPLWADKLRRLW